MFSAGIFRVILSLSNEPISSFFCYQLGISLLFLLPSFFFLLPSSQVRSLSYRPSRMRLASISHKKRGRKTGRKRGRKRGSGGKGGGALEPHFSPFSPFSPLPLSTHTHTHTHTHTTLMALGGGGGGQRGGTNAILLFFFGCEGAGAGASVLIVTAAAVSIHRPPLHTHAHTHTRPYSLIYSNKLPISHIAVSTVSFYSLSGFTETV